MSMYGNYLREVRGYAPGITLSQIARIKTWLQSGGLESLFHMERREDKNLLWLSVYFPGECNPVDIEVHQLNVLVNRKIKAENVLSSVRGLLTAA